MNKFNIISVITICVISNALFAQEGYINRELSDIINQLNWNKKIQMDAPEISGSPYLDKEFKEADIYTNDKYKISKVRMRYNLYNDEFQFENKNMIMAIADPGRIDKIVIGDEVFIYLNDKEQKTVSGYVKQWNSRLPAVITKMKVNFFEKEKPKPYTEPKPDRFERAQDEHYLMKSKNEIENVGSVKKLIKSLGDHEAELSEFAKKEKISAGDPAELAKLLDYFHLLE